MGFEPEVRRYFEFPVELDKRDGLLTPLYHICACQGVLYVSTVSYDTALYGLGLGLRRVAKRELALAKDETTFLIHPADREKEKFFDERRGKVTLGIVSGLESAGRRRNAVRIVELDALCRGTKVVCILDEFVTLRHNPWLRAMLEPHKSMH